MSAPTSPSSRSPSSVSELIGGFDGERDIRRAWVRGLTPDRQLTVCRSTPGKIARPDGSAIEVKTEASILPINKRPRLAVRILSSN